MTDATTETPADDRCDSIHNGIPCSGIRNHGAVIRETKGGGTEQWEHAGQGLTWGFIGAYTGSGSLVTERTP